MKIAKFVFIVCMVFSFCGCEQKAAETSGGKDGASGGSKIEHDAEKWLSEFNLTYSKDVLSDSNENVDGKESAIIDAKVKSIDVSKELNESFAKIGMDSSKILVVSMELEFKDGDVDTVWLLNVTNKVGRYFKNVVDGREGKPYCIKIMGLDNTKIGSDKNVIDILPFSVYSQTKTFVKSEEELKLFIDGLKNFVNNSKNAPNGNAGRMSIHRFVADSNADPYTCVIQISLPNEISGPKNRLYPSSSHMCVKMEFENFSGGTEEILWGYRKRDVVCQATEDILKDGKKHLFKVTFSHSKDGNAGKRDVVVEFINPDLNPNDEMQWNDFKNAISSKCAEYDNYVSKRDVFRKVNSVWEK